MTCINPKFATFQWTKILNPKTQKFRISKQIKFLPLQKLEPDSYIKDNFLTIPCGKCQGCKVDYANSFATRAIIEIQNYKLNCFVTLTYNKSHLPKNRNLVKKDLQDFWKRLRHEQEEPIRYLACGEYGPKTLRPHYHALIFNYLPKDLKFYKRNITNDCLYTSERLNKIWGNGYVIIGQATYETAAYVARYVYKKAYGLNKNFWLKANLTPEFTLSSRRPGLGTSTITDKEQFAKLKRNFGIFVQTKNGTKIKPIPEFLRRKWRETNAEEYFKISEQRAREIKNETRARLEKTSLNYYEYIKLKASQILEKLKRLDKRQDL